MIDFFMYPRPLFIPYCVAEILAVRVHIHHDRSDIIIVRLLACKLCLELLHMSHKSQRSVLCGRSHISNIIRV